VIKVGDDYFLIPETHQLSEVRIYKATIFPYQWTYDTTVISGRKFVDPSVLYVNGRWWLFVSDSSNKNLYLYSSASLLRNWKEHPLSPIIQNDSTRARPGGRAFVYNRDHVIRIAQSFGDVLSVRAFQVDVLTTQQYSEHEIPESPLLEPGDHPLGWFEAGMHQFDPWWTGDHWIAVYDGRAMDNRFSIGIKIADNP
jgi:hypothetical protein